MNPYPQVEEDIFLAALEVPVAERTDFVARECARSQASTERVLALIKGYESHSSFLENPALILSADGGQDGSSVLAPVARPGERIGAYTLVEQLGEGTFGVVFLAEQSAPIRRRVALKILRVGMDTREFIARFEVERQALALMDHPNIARVFDAGATTTGRPYLVMELIVGIPITAYCDQKQLTIRQRLDLFLQVCAALEHAHQKGIIHRDLKPSNILVTEDAGRPMPKLIDFGIAKATRAPLTDQTMATRAHSLIGTPAYASPEQMDVDLRSVDTRSDLYSLGALLYELLAGTPPFRREILDRASFDQLRKIIRETVPASSSRRLLSLSSAELQTVASARSSDSRRLKGQLKGDLDWITLRCLEKEPARRYEGTSALAADIRRHLAHEPVLASPPAWTYRAGKFIRRHRTPVTAGCAVLATLLYALIATRVSLARESAARERAVAAEQLQAELRQQAEDSRTREFRRASRALVDLGDHRLAQGRTGDALAYFAHAARQDPTNPTLAPRLASLLTSRSFLLPTGTVAQHSAPVLAVDYSDDGKRLVAIWRDGMYGRIDLETGNSVIERLTDGLRSSGACLTTRGYMLIYCPDGVIRSLDRQTGRVANEINFDNDPLGCNSVPNSTDLVTTKLSSSEIMLCDAATGRMIGKPISYDGLLSAGPKWLAWTADGKAGPSNELWLRDTGHPENELLIRLPVGVTRDRLITSPQGNRMVTLTRKHPQESSYQLRLWSLPEATPLAEPRSLERSAWLIYSPDGRHLLCWGKDIEVFAADTLTRVARLPAGRFVDPTKYTFSPDGKTLVTWANAETVDVWDLDAGGPRIAPLKTGGNVSSVTFSRDGRVLLTSSDGLARVWHVETGALLAEPTLQLRGVPAVAISPDGAQLTIGTGEGAVHQFRLAHLTRSDPGMTNAMSPKIQSLEIPHEPGLPLPFLPGSPTRVLWMGADHARILELASGRQLSSIAYPERVKFAEVRTDGRVAVVQTTAGGWQIWWLSDQAVQRVVPLRDDSAESASVIFSPADNQVALSRARRLRVWSLETGRAVGPEISTTVNTWYSQFPSFSPDGRRIALGSIEGSARIWDVASGTAVHHFGAQPTSITQANFSPDGTRIVSGSRFSSLRLWDGDTATPLTPALQQPGMYGQGVFSPDSRLVATFTADRLVIIRDARDGTAVQSIDVDGALRSVRFSSDRARLLTTTSEGVAQVWDVGTGLAVAEPLRHGQMRVDAGEISPNGDFIRTATFPEEKFTFWALPPAPTAGQPAPSWLLELATFCAGKHVAANGQLESLPFDSGRLETLRRQVETLSPEAPYAAWGRWFFEDPATRSIAPGFTLSPTKAATFGREMADGEERM